MFIQYFKTQRMKKYRTRVQEFEKQFRKLTIEDREWVEQACHEDGSVSNGVSFLSMLLFQEMYEYDLFSKVNGCVAKCPWIEGDTLFCTFPVGSPENREKTVKEIVKLYTPLCSKVSFLAVTGEDFEQLQKMYPEKIVFYENSRNDQNYILDVQEQIKLEGSAFADRRNKIRRFNKLYNLTWEPITEENVDACLKLQAEWGEAYGDDSVTKEEDLTTGIILKYFHELDVQGELYRIDGLPVAFAIGCPQNSKNKNCYFHCVSKAKKEYRDVTIATLHDFIKRNCSEYTYSNYSCDVGVPGLRKFKMMLRPKFLTDFYKVTIDLKK